MACPRHPRARVHRGHCAVCLLEEALALSVASKAPDLNFRGAPRELTIQVPLGESASAAVFLVKADGAALRFLRLKTWKTPAPEGFLSRFQDLQARLDDWAEESIDPPLAAGVDVLGRPWVLTQFRQGVPILDGVRRGRLRSEDAVARLTPLIALTQRAHARGLVHGSIVAGNVIVQAQSSPACLLDFGIAPLFGLPGNEVAFASADLVGFEALARTLRGLHPHPTGKRSL